MSKIRTVRQMLASTHPDIDLTAIVMPRATFDAIVKTLTASRDRKVRVGLVKSSGRLN